jgi:uroporphyrinogen decarboxylase
MTQPTRTALTSYERVKAALEHREPDRVPFDLGGSVLTGMHRVAYQNLRKYLGLPERDVEIYDRCQQLSRIHDDVLDRLKVDVRCVDPGAPAKPGLAREPWVEDGSEHFVDEWGIMWRKPAEHGFYFDMVRHPLADARTVRDLEQYSWPDPEDDARFATMKARADACVNEEQRAYILGRHAAGIFEVALWMRGFEDFFVDMGDNPGFAEALLDIITENKMRYWKRALETVGENVLVVSEADDLSTQAAPFISPAMYRRFIMPRHRRLFDMIKAAAKNRVYVFYHSCGAIRQMIPLLIEEGVEVLNPVQVSARGMDSRDLKRDFGDQVTFWGGGVDTQHVLPHGTPAEVRAEVKRRVEDFAPGGGFVFNTVHNVQADVPPENYMAMWEALQEFGTY